KSLLAATGSRRDSHRPWIRIWGAGQHQTFAWQDGYFAFSIGESGVDALRQYIANQKEHHKSVSFIDEMRAFLDKYGIARDERYIWE
ncbi:MAG: transposase, partial [Phycisphaerales bacterium]|nr:transposase [Phycisphaerales bacterium]